MKAEIIAVGSELLLGQIINTNARFISSHLAEVGIDVYYQTVVGDNPERLAEIIKIAERRADLLIFTGGLGPTKDDLTKETIASLIGKQLVMDEQALASIQTYFQRTGRSMTDNNRKQAMVLTDSYIFENTNGMAPGMAVPTNSHMYILLPGPPHEMEPMFLEGVLPYLQHTLGRHEIIKSVTVKFFNIGEAELTHKLHDLLDAQTNPTIAPLASKDSVTLRVTAKALTADDADQLIQPVLAKLNNEVGKYIYGTDEDTLASKAAELLITKKVTISAAESLTAGLFTSLLAEHSGISSVLKGGMTVYDADTKVQQLGVERELLESKGIVSAECAKALAEKVRVKFRSDIGVGLTGAAGPDPHDGQPAGTVFIGLSFAGKTEVYQLSLSGTRNTNRLRAANYALYYLIRHLEKL